MLHHGLRLWISLLLCTAGLSGCALFAPRPEPPAPRLSPVREFIVSHTPGEPEATGMVSDPEFGNNLRIVLEQEFLSASGETCRRASLFAPGGDAEMVVMCRQAGGDWVLAPRVWGRGLRQGGSGGAIPPPAQPGSGAPATPAPTAPAPTAPAPAAPAPAAPAPAAPASATPAPTAPAPAAPAPATPAPATLAPATPAPQAHTDDVSAPAPEMPAPATPAPETPAPATPAPSTAPEGADAPPSSSAG